MKIYLLCFSLLGLIPVMHFTGGVESGIRMIYYPLMVLFIPLNSMAMLLSSLTFCILYAMLPFFKAGAYPSYTVVINIF